ncbi:MAG: hypothetical protein LBQ52_04930 [Helicobacteraceae bacterium]|jgi:hypothetical protein|nr:hypothetical protein [Helicobacteraceae bacterium]
MTAEEAVKIDVANDLLDNLKKVVEQIDALGVVPIGDIANVDMALTGAKVAHVALRNLYHNVRSLPAVDNERTRETLRSLESFCSTMELFLLRIDPFRKRNR